MNLNLPKGVLKVVSLELASSSLIQYPLLASILSKNVAPLK